MEQFVTIANFNKVPYDIPAAELSTDGIVLTTKFSNYIDEQQADILKKILGIELYDEFESALAEDYPDQKWLDLRDGVRYQYLTNTYEWVGLNKMLTPFIFSMWLRDNYDNYSNSGVSISNNENSNVVSPDLRIVQAWNKFYSYLGRCDRNVNTLHGFLYVNEDTNFPTWLFTDVGSMNRFNL